MYTVEIFLVKNKELVSLFADQRQRSKFTSKEQEHCQNFLRVENCNQLSRNTIALWFNKKKNNCEKKSITHLDILLKQVKQTRAWLTMDILVSS